MSQNREEDAAALIKGLNEKGFRAKVFAPLPEHKTSGHVHVVCLCTLDEKVELGLGLEREDGGIPTYRDILKQKNLAKYQCLRCLWAFASNDAKCPKCQSSDVTLLTEEEYREQIGFTLEDGPRQ